jgi:hypothetical protein
VLRAEEFKLLIYQSSVLKDFRNRLVPAAEKHYLNRLAQSVMSFIKCRNDWQAPPPKPKTQGVRTSEILKHRVKFTKCKTLNKAVKSTIGTVLVRDFNRKEQNFNKDDLLPTSSRSIHQRTKSMD